MPRELVAVAPRTPVLREYEEQPLKPNELRIKNTKEKFLVVRKLYPITSQRYLYWKKVITDQRNGSVVYKGLVLLKSQLL